MVWSGQAVSIAGQWGLCPLTVANRPSLSHTVWLQHRSSPSDAPPHTQHPTITNP